MRLLRSLVTIIPGLLLAQCAPAVHPVATLPLPQAAGGEELVVSSLVQLESAFARWAADARTPVTFRLSPQMMPQWRSILHSDAWGEYARRCSVAYREDGLVTLTLEYRDYVRLRRACHDTAFRASLSADEREAFLRVQSMVQQALRPGMSGFDKLLALHDLLVSQSKYDADGGCNIIDILRGKAGSCEAYSSTLSVMLELAGIPSRVVVGQAGEPHAWNLVCLEGVWYHVDATWDDPIIRNGSRELVSHAWFCLSDAEISRTHQWKRASYPATGKTTAWYYRRRGIYFADFESFWQAATAEYRRGGRLFEGYLATYGNAEAFQNNLKRCVSRDTPRSISWTGPETPAGPVILTFGSH